MALKTEQRLAAQFEIVRVLSQHQSHDKSISEVLGVIGRLLGWTMGALWVVDKKKNLLVYHQLWSISPHKMAKFEEATKKFKFSKGVGLPGRVWAAKKACWIEDVTKDSNFLRARAASAAGLHGAFAFPLIYRQKVLGVIDFFHHQIVTPDLDLLEMMNSVGHQIGYFLAHKAVEEEREILLKEVEKAREKAEQVAIESEERASELDAVFMALVDALLVYDVKGVVVGANFSAMRMFGFNPIGQDQVNLSISLQSRHRRGEIISKDEMLSTQALKGNVISSKHLILKDASGKDIMVVASASPIRHRDKVTGAVVILHDVSESWQVEKQKDTFIATASHEIKTPVTTIKAFIQILQKRLDKSEEGEASRYLSKVDLQLNRLTGLIEELLDVTRIEAGKLDLHWEELDIDELVNETVEDFQRIADTHCLIRHGRVESTIMGDRDRLNQVLINLISNAIKYSPQSNKIVVRTAKKKNEVVVSIQDFGIGIPKKDRPQIFERFYRVKNATGERFGGLGLGLYISSEIILKHGGRIGVRSEEGRGSTFFFTLPLKGKED
ncbi:MAG: Multi-sensor signal transduction histidine kinase [Candidatus Daviesbacteria bacterium GW2011_GWA2_40_9]|uniref:histidine kinase n=1 Tax=Candidatus Daviesbacteria bacterium GW2011_GWA2_40_9 TaxID=1618424 RepID=A0A0G0U070_9BACT|nr:MAG: Multi-sensor signal transduction histidine kinase [Candidatus Daviesbacteria bacterium GW2011_GWC1_40_9]KKR82478.1 MAG: Multi-sensor signal transduction histidine kinase [Candidatus Daviesbacteria bacterium GW2011_GWA2_40_9]